MKSSSDSLLRSRFTRRTATVTISAPETSMAACVSAPSLYFPCPNNQPRRELRAPQSPIRPCAYSKSATRSRFLRCAKGDKRAGCRCKHNRPVPKDEPICGVSVWVDLRHPLRMGLGRTSWSYRRKAARTRATDALSLSHLTCCCATWTINLHKVWTILLSRVARK